MEKKKLKLLLNKEVISTVQLRSISGGTGFTCATDINMLSCGPCVSNEANCHSNSPGCDCGTSGNCGPVSIG